MFRQKVQAKYDDLTPSFRKIADFILEDKLEAAFMTATEMAHHLGVDAATVVRFSQYLGYSGYRELIHEIQGVVKQEILAVYRAAGEATDEESLIGALLENERQSLERAAVEAIPSLTTVTRVLSEANKVWVVSAGSGLHMARFMAGALQVAGVKAQAVSADPVDAALAIKAMEPNDVVMGLVVLGLSPTIASVIQIARQRGLKTIVFSSSPVAPAARSAEHIVLTPARTPTRVPSFASQMAMLSVVWQVLIARGADRASDSIVAYQNAFSELMGMQAEQAAEGAATSRGWMPFLTEEETK